MIGCLGAHMEKHGWHSVSINPGPHGFQFIIQAKSEKRREDEARQRAAQDDCDRVVCAPQMLSSATTKVGARLGGDGGRHAGARAALPVRARGRGASKSNSSFAPVVPLLSHSHRGLPIASAA